MSSGLWLDFSRTWLRLFSRCLVGLIFGGLALSAVALELNPEQARERIRALRAEIAHHDELYFKKAAPEISDASYDRLKRELIDLEKANPAMGRDAALAPVLGDDRSGLFPTYRHRERMLSLSKSYAETELRAFDARLTRQLGHGDLEYVVEPKFDGLAISVTYEKGKLVRAVTRGDGVEGDEITANALTIPTLRRELRTTVSAGARNPVPDIIELRGEIYFSYAEFARINREREEAGEEPYANPRNLAAGTLKQSDPREVARRQLEIVFYGWGDCQPVSLAPVSQLALLAQLRAWGLPTIEAPRLVRGSEAMWQAVKAVGREKKNLPFPIDGAVVKLNAAAERQRLGATELAPNWAMAYKFQTEQVVTQVRGITLQVGRSGVLTPVAELEPVPLGGSTIARATLHNRDEIARRDIRIGDFVQVEKAGEIIPMITAVVLARRSASAVSYVFPEECPACRTRVVSVVGEAAVRCPKGNCPAQVRRRIEHFASKTGVDIAGLGPATIESLVSQGRVKTVADIYRLKRVDLLTISGVGEKKADKLLAAIERSRHAELWRFINGLGIPQVGAITAKALALRCGSLPELAQCSRQELVPLVGKGAADSLLVFFAQAENRQLAAALLAGGVQPVATRD